MTIEEVLKKVVAGEELTAEEKTFLNEYKSEGSENRIPKSRLDQEIAKFKAEKEKSDKLETELSELKEQLEELQNNGKSEAEKAKAATDKEFAKLKKQVDDLTKERDGAKAQLAKSERTAKVAALASKHKFVNAEYLDFLAASKELDLDDEAAATSFMAELGKSNPELFASTVRPGGGTTGTGNDSDGARQRISELLKKPELSTREAGEVIKLQQEIASEGAKNTNANKGE